MYGFAVIVPDPPNDPPVDADHRLKCVASSEPAMLDHDTGAEFATDPADVGMGGVVEGQAHLRSSRIVFPMRTLVPSEMAVAWVIRRLPT